VHVFKRPIFRIAIKLESNKICETKKYQILHHIKSMNLISSQDSSSYRPLYDLSDRIRFIRMSKGAYVNGLMLSFKEVLDDMCFVSTFSNFNFVWIYLSILPFPESD
jgi:hypothetical protein